MIIINFSGPFSEKTPHSGLGVDIRDRNLQRLKQLTKQDENLTAETESYVESTNEKSFGTACNP